MDDFLENIKGIIIAQIRADKTIERITQDLLKSFLEDFKVSSEGRRFLTEIEREGILKELINYFIADIRYDNDFVELIRGVSIVDPDYRLHTPWTPAASSRFYWRKQREFLMLSLIQNQRNNNDEAARIINSIDFETEEILKNMENPLNHKFDSRGLVVGYVQSGKTANFTALISKAADAGYRFVLVLAGIHDELRQQTQIRIDRELTGHNNLNLSGIFIDWNDQEEPKRWMNLTSAGWLDGKETGEFSGKGINKFRDIFLNRNRPVIAIIKKNVSILNRLVKWIEDSSEDDRRNVPLLIIDDEADQASVDGNANKKDTLPTETNKRIRIILKNFERTAYVGYTATPFANVFIKHDTEDDVYGNDLYPRNYIHSLPEPSGYFGTRKIFHDNLDKYFVREIKDPKKERKQLSERGIVTEELIESIYTFIICIAIRNIRGQGNQPMSMMINVDHRVNKMNRFGEEVKVYIERVLPSHYNKDYLADTYHKVKTSASGINKYLNTNSDHFKTSKVVDEAIRIINHREVKVRVLNSSKDDKLDYAKDPSMKVIAIGGNKLSRGLTLDGLMTTFYLRESKQFDTLLQMGRWFGYRKGYEDLIRIYTSNKLWLQFKDLAVVELEFRENIKEMLNDNKTPREFAIGVRHILGLLPTARNKLGEALLEQFYGGRQVSVTKLLLEKTTLIDKNEEYTAELIMKVIESGVVFKSVNNNPHPSKLAENISVKIIKPFLEKFNIAMDVDNSYIDFDKDNLINYINQKNKEGFLLNWNIGIVSLKESDERTKIIPLPGGINIIPVNRSRLILPSTNGSYNIKAINSKPDRKMDLNPNDINEYENRINPLLLIYYVNRYSTPIDQENGYREALYLGLEELMRDPVAYSIIFPSDNKGVGVYRQNIN